MNSHSHKSGGRSGNCAKTLWLLVTAWLLLPVFAPSMVAQVPTAPSDSPGRFLFIVDTSLSMHRRAKGVRKTLEGMLDSNLDGHLRAGDLIGVWTFNEDVFTDRFQVRAWSPANRSVATASVLEFLGKQRYEKKTDLDKVLTKAFQLMRQSPTLTLVLFTDGEEPVRGTPFDEAINSAFGAMRGEQQRTRMPIVTVLRAEGGRFASHAVGQPPWPISIPALPVEERALASRKAEPTAPAKSESPEPKPAKPPAVVAKPKPVPPPVAKVESAPPAPEKPAEPKPESKPSEVIAVEPTPPKRQPTPDPKPTIVEQTPPAIPAPEKTAAPPVTPPKPSPTEIAKVEPAPAPPPKTESPVSSPPEPGAPAKPISNTPPPATVAAEATPKPAPPTEAGKVLAGAEPAPKATPIVPAPTRPDSLPKPTEVKAPPLVESKPAESLPNKAAATVGEAKAAPPEAEQKPQLSSQPPPPRATPPAVENKAVVAENSKPTTDATKPAAETAQPDRQPEAQRAEPVVLVQTAIASAPQPVLSGHRLLVAGLLLLGVAAGLLWLIVRRSRATATATSLITQSFDRDKDGPAEH